MVQMRDGIKLFTSVYMPRDASKTYPMLMKRTPYSCSPYGETKMSKRFQNMNLAREGYIFITQDVRGKYMSEGEFMDVRPYNAEKKGTETDENSDTYDTVDWLVKNVPNNNGRIGIYGISYPGFYATMSLMNAHPAIKAVSPQAPVTDWFIGDDFHHNGALMLMDAFSFYSGFGKARPKPTTENADGFELPTPDNYDFYLKLGSIKNVNDKYFHNEIKFWNDLTLHPNYDEWWRARNIRQHLAGVKPAVLVVGGLFDAEDCFGAFRTYEAIEKLNPAYASNRLVMGPWFHGNWGGRGDGSSLGNVAFNSKTAEYYQEKIEAPFFNFHLKDKGTNSLPEATVFQTGSNEWKNYAKWPPAESSMKKMYFQENGVLNFNQPLAASSFDEYVSDPNKPVPYTEDVHKDRTRQYMTDDQRFASRRPDVIVYETEVLKEDMTISGTINANLFVSTTGTDADFVVKIIDVFPDDSPTNGVSKVPIGGYQMLVRGEIMRARFRRSFEKPTPMTPNKQTDVTFQLPDVNHSFKKGHKLMIQVQSSWFPLADRNPQTFVDIYNAKSTDFVKATHRIYHEKNFMSNVELPIVK